MKCGLCQQQVPGGMRDLNQHKAERHPEERQAMRAQRKARMRPGVSMNRCNDCSKFVSLEASEPECNQIDIDEDGNIEAEVRLILTCSDCAGEMHESPATVESDGAADFVHGADCKMEEGFSIDNPTWNVLEGGGGRFSKHTYAGETTALVTCDKCQATLEVQISTEEVAASYFESLQ